MFSRQESPFDLDSTASQVSITTSSTALPNAFNRLMSQPASQRDRCKRPALVYNHNYDLYKEPPVDTPLMEY